jgi:hypothetical protein
MKTHDKHNLICLFWSSAEKICKMQDSGLFIPLDDHIEIYCKRAEHVLCQQYKLSVSAKKESQEDKGIETINRRMHPRIKGNYNLTLLRLNESGNIISDHPSTASTLDLSSAGMRLTTRELLMHDSIIQFHFKNSFPSPLKSGLAQVKWCIPAGNDLQYMAGLAFQSDQVIQAMNRCFGTQM